MKKLFLYMALGFAALGVGATEAPKELNITYVKAPFNVHCMAMKTQGMLEKEFAQEGIKINWIDIKAGLNQVRGMAAGEIDMSCAMNTSTLLIANSVGNLIKIVDGVARPDAIFALVTKDAKTVADLKGKTVVGPKGTVLHHLLNAALAKEGLTEADVKFISMTQPASLTTLLAGRADAALISAAGVLKAQDAGFTRLVSAQDLVKTQLVLAARETFAMRYPDVVQRVKKVTRDAIAWAQQDPEGAIELGAKTLNIPNQYAETLYGWTSLASGVNEADIEALRANQKELIAQKMMTNPVDLKALFLTE